MRSPSLAPESGRFLVIDLVGTRSRFATTLAASALIRRYVVSLPPATWT